MKKIISKKNNEKNQQFQNLILAKKAQKAVKGGSDPIIITDIVEI